MWWPVVFWVLLVPLLVVLGITYASTRKLYRLCHLLALFTYIVLIAYAIDVFMLNKNWILGLLFLSSLLIIGTGVYVSKQTPKKKKNQTGVWPLWTLLSVMLILLVLGMFGTAFLTRTVQVIPLPTTMPPDESVDVLTLTYTNNYFLPIGLPQNQAQLCSGSSERYDPWLENTYQDTHEVMPGETKEITYSLRSGPKIDPRLNETQKYPQGMYIALGEQPLSCTRYNERFDLSS